MPPALRQLALGLLQGPAEMLPVSSSAHLALLHEAGASPSERKELEVGLHLGSAVAFLAMRPRIRPAFLTAATVPPVLAGFLLMRVVEERLGTPRTIAAGLLAGSAAMVLADRAPEVRTEPDWRDGLAIGLGQACALMPGVSRSGASWAAARSRGFTRQAATTLSREAALPVLVGAAVLKTGGVRDLAPGIATAALSTTLASRLPIHRVPAWPWTLYRSGMAAAILAVRDTRSA